MDEKVIFVIIYPIWVLLTALAAVFVTAYFLPDRRRTSSSGKSVPHRIRK